MKIIDTIASYYREIWLPAPKYPSFHIGRHEENLATIKRVQEPIKHELYSISLIDLDQGEVGLNINNSTFNFRLFIITPFRSINWDLTNKKFKGIYVIFDQEFIKSNALWENFLISFPYFKLENILTDNFPEKPLLEIRNCFEKIHEEYYSNSENPFELIQGYLHIVLLLIKKHNLNTMQPGIVSLNQLVLAKFENLLVYALERPESNPDLRKPSFYASKLNIHTNHLNSILKGLTGKTTSRLIYDGITNRAGLLINTKNITIKDLAARFHFKESTHFISFFKKQTGFTPKQYRSKTPT